MTKPELEKELKEAVSLLKISASSQMYADEQMSYDKRRKKFLKKYWILKGKDQ